MFKGYKTIVFNLVMALIAIVKALNPDAETPDAGAVSTGVDQFLVGLGAVWAFGSIVIRAVTHSPIFNRDRQPPPAG